MVLAESPALCPRFRELAGRERGVAALWEEAPGPSSRALISADGCVDVIVRVDGDGRITTVVSPPTARAELVTAEKDQRVLGVRFHVGYGAPLLAKEATIREEVERAARSRIDLTVLEALITAHVEEPPAIVRDFVAHAREGGGSFRLGDLFESTGAERRLQRAAARFIGLAPKTILRIERARAARALLIAGEAPIEVAGVLGYADQAHLTRELKTLLGLTPRVVGNVQDRARAVAVTSRP